MYCVVFKLLFDVKRIKPIFMLNNQNISVLLKLIRNNVNKHYLVRLKNLNHNENIFINNFFRNKYIFLMSDASQKNKSNLKNYSNEYTVCSKMSAQKKTRN